MVKPKYELLFTKQATKDAELVGRAGLKPKTQELLDIIRHNPFQTPPPYEKLQGNLNGAHSRRINIKHRLVYEVVEGERYIKIIRMWSHYGDN